MNNFCFEENNKEVLFISEKYSSNRTLYITPDGLENIKNFADTLKDNYPKIPNLSDSSINLKEQLINKSIFITNLTFSKKSSFKYLNINSFKFKNFLKRINCKIKNNRSKRPNYYIVDIPDLYNKCTSIIYLLLHQSKKSYFKIDTQDLLNYLINKNDSEKRKILKHYETVLKNNSKYKYCYIQKNLILSDIDLLEIIIEDKIFLKVDISNKNNYLFRDIINDNLDINSLIPNNLINDYLLNEGTYYDNPTLFSNKLEQLISSKGTTNIDLAIDLLKNANLTNLNYKLLKLIIKIYNSYLGLSNIFRPILIRDILNILGLSNKVMSHQIKDPFGDVDPLKLALFNIKIGNKKLLSDLDLILKDFKKSIKNQYSISIKDIEIELEN